jgi:hypothetical protein
VLTPKSLRIHLETRNTTSTIMNIFVEPVTEDQIEEIQSNCAAEVDLIERNLLGIPGDEPRIEQAQVEQHNGSAKVEARVEETLGSEATHPAQRDGSPVTSKTSNEARLKRDFNQYFDGDPHPQDILDRAGEKAAIKDYASKLDEQMVAQSSDGSNELSDARNAYVGEDRKGGNRISDEELVALTMAGSLRCIDINHDESGAFAEDIQVQISEDGRNLDGGMLALEPAEAAFDVSADSTFLDSMAESITAAPNADVTAWTLSIRNKVNDVHVRRPKGLSATDKWEVEYSLTEVANPQHTSALYELCQKRRRSIFQKDIDDVPQGPYFELLRRLSRDGVHWREQMDEADKGKPRKVLPSSATVPTDQNEEK